MGFFRFLKKRMLRLVAVLLWLPLTACGFFYHADAIEGWVVDPETGKPLAGVIVVAHWQLQGGLEGGIPIEELKIYEAVTDENGHYRFAPWGPKFALSGKLESESPEILFFKPGYRYLRLVNQWYGGMDTSKSQWNGKTIELERFKGTLAEYAEHLSSMTSSLWRIGFDVGRHSGDYCGWESFSQMLRQLNQLEAEFRAAGVVQGTAVSRFKANDKLLAEKGCASIFQVLNGPGR